MTKIIKHFFIGCSTGISIGFVVALGFSIFNNSSTFEPSSPIFTSRFTNNLSATIISAILWMIIGLIFTFSAFIFKKEEWSITKQTIIHFLLTSCLFTTIAIIAGWFPLKITFFISYAITYIIIYVIIWIISMNIAKARIKQINQLIK